MVPKPTNFAAKAAFATLTPLFQCELQCSAEKHKSITHAAATTRNCDAATPLRSANNELQNAKELRTQAPQIAAICSSKTRSRRQSGKTMILKRCKENKRKLEKKISKRPKKSKKTLPFLQPWGANLNITR